MQGMDISLFAGRSHLDSDQILANPSRNAVSVSEAVKANGLEIADVFGQPGRKFGYMR